MNILFIVDGSLSNPILFSQGIPHILENVKKGNRYFIISFEDLKFLQQNPEAKKRYDVAIEELREYAYVFSIKTNITYRFSTLRILIYGTLIGFKIVKRNKIDIIHGRSNLPSLIGLIIRCFIKVKVLYDNRGLASDEFFKKNKLRISFEKLLEKYLLKNANSIVVVSNAFKNYLIENYHHYNLDQRIKVIENSFSEKRFIYSEQLRIKQRKDFKLDNKFVMIYSGSSMFWQKFDLILETFKLLKKIKGEAYLLVISYDPLISEVIIESGIDNSDFSVYNVSASEVNKYLIIGDFGVIFRDDRIRSKVCAPIKLGEYLASGLPILCMDQIGDTDELILKYNVGVIIEDGKEIKNKLKEIIKLTNEPNIKLRCRKAAEEKLSLTSAANKYHLIYKNIK